MYIYIYIERERSYIMYYTLYIRFTHDILHMTASQRASARHGPSQVPVATWAWMLGNLVCLYICCLHFSMCACHPCAGAMLIFSVSFQF